MKLYPIHLLVLVYTQVYEVNSSSIRSRAQLLSGLKEATLSHQVTVRDRSATSGGLSSGGLMSFFQSAPKKSVPKKTNSVSLETSTVILLDEVIIPKCLVYKTTHNIVVLA